VTHYPYSSTHRIEPVGNWLWKDLGPGGFLATMSGRPEFVEDRRREPAAYREVIGPLGLGPRCIASGLDWVLLERVDSPELWQIGEAAVWVATVRWMATMHRLLASRAAVAVPLLAYDARVFAQWHRRAAGNGAPDSVLNAHRRAVRHLTTLPRTTVHGDLYPSNVLVRVAEDPPSHGSHAGVDVCVVDWELIGHGPAVLDVAALTSGSWSPSERRAMSHAYFEAAGYPGSPTRWDHDLDAARLHLCVQWLGAPSAWSPPDQHAHGWLDEATELAERM
jgi:hypothetical protein